MEDSITQEYTEDELNRLMDEAERVLISNSLKAKTEDRLKGKGKSLVFATMAATGGVLLPIAGGIAGANETGTVQSGDTYWGLETQANPEASGAQIETDIAQGAADSGIANPNNLHDGQQVTIITPSNGNTIPVVSTVTQSTSTAIVQSGNTLWGLETQANPGATDPQIQADVDQAAQSNGLVNANNLHIGQKLTLVGPASANAATGALAPNPTANAALTTIDMLIKPGYTYSTVAVKISGVTATPVGNVINQLENLTKEPASLLKPGTAMIDEVPASQVAAVEAAVSTIPTVQAPNPVPAPVPASVTENAPLAITPESTNEPALPILSMAQATEIAINSQTECAQPYMEQWAIGVLTQLSQYMNVPLNHVLTQEHVVALLAWGWLEKGDLDNQDTYNVLNTGIDDPSLLASPNSVSGLQAFVSLKAGEQGDVETFMSPLQNRLATIFTDPNSTAENIIYVLTNYQNYAGNLYWATADDPHEGYSQLQYLNTLYDQIDWVRENYTDAATAVLGRTYDMDAPHISPTYLQFSGNGVATPAPSTPATTAEVTPLSTTSNSGASANIPNTSTSVNTESPINASSSLAKQPEKIKAFQGSGSAAIAPGNSASAQIN
jgi:hypothetical protein